MKSRLTILDVAREAGVSKTAVSFAFNSPQRLAPATLKKILNISDTLGYVPDPTARRLARRSSGNLGVLIPQTLPEAFVHPHFQEMFQGIGEFCERREFSLTLIPPLQGCLLKAVRNAAVDGVITLGFTPSETFLDLLGKRSLPLVTVDSRIDSTIPSVTFEDREAARDLLRAVLGRGYRNLHILTFPVAPEEVRGNAGSRSLSRRLQGFRQALDELKSENVFVSYGSSRVTAESACESLMEQQWEAGLPQVVVCLSDAQASGVYVFAEKKGLRIPEDLAVTGFDGSLSLKHLRPVMTTVRQPGFLKGKLACELMDEQWRDRATVRHLVVKAHMVEGKSLGQMSKSWPND
ncbi:MAG: LacI family DNA-binding transcriptional regulator [Spirochaetales bacterium]